MSTYFWSFFDVGNVGLDTEGPINVQSTFVQLKQEDDQNEESVKHEEEKDGFVAQLDQISSNTSLLNRIIRWVMVCIFWD